MKTDKKKTCGQCKYHRMERCSLPPNGIIILSETEACRHFQQKTNVDKIRQMSGIELANMFADACPPNIHKKCRGTIREDCFTCWLEWLESEVKE